MINDSLGERMKMFEDVYRYKLPPNSCWIIRVDGRAFHTLTRGMETFDSRIISIMNEVGFALAKEFSSARIAYIQSDEVSLLIKNHHTRDEMFGRGIQKLASISAACATMAANQWCRDVVMPSRKMMFDSRIFAIPESEVANYFIWRQHDWARNSVQMQARKYFSHTEIQNKNNMEILDMLHEREVDWEYLPTDLKRGRCIVKAPDKTVHWTWRIDNHIPIFTKNRDYIEKFLKEE